jgi:hypothetical protein
MLMFVGFHRGGFPLFSSLLATLVGGVSFSQLIFGSIPDHFALSGFCLAAACVLAVESVRTGKVHWVLWIVLGVLAVGITITNLVWLGILLAVPRMLARWEWKVIRESVVWSLAVMAATMAISEVGNRLHDNKNHLWSFPEAGRYAQDFSQEGILKLAKAPAALAHTFSPPRFETIPNVRAKEMNIGRPYLFSLERTSAWLLNLVVMVLLGTGLVGWLRDKSNVRFVAAAALLIVVFNLVLHAIWSAEYVVFSQHWLAPSVFLAAGNLRFGGRYRLFGLTSLSVFVVWMLYNNSMLIQEILTMLSNNVVTPY